MADRVSGRSALGDATGEPLERLQSKRSNIDDKIKYPRSIRDTNVAPLQRNTAQLNGQILIGKRKLNNKEHHRSATSPATLSSNNAPSMAVGAPLPRSTGDFAGEGSRRIVARGGATTAAANARTNPPHRRQQARASGGHGAIASAQANSTLANTHPTGVASQSVAGTGGTGASSRPSTEKEESFIHEDFSMVIMLNGKWRELKCHFCGANRPKNNSDFFEGVAGLLLHAASTIDHPKIDDREKFLLKCVKWTFSDADVSKMKAGQYPTDRVISKTRGDANGGSIETDGRASSTSRMSTSAAFIGIVLQGDGLPDPTSEQQGAGPPVRQSGYPGLLDSMPVERIQEAPSGTAELAKGIQQDVLQDSQTEDQGDSDSAFPVQGQHDLPPDSVNRARPSVLQAKSRRPPVITGSVNGKQKDVLQEHHRREEISAPVGSTAQEQYGMAASASRHSSSMVALNMNTLHSKLGNTAHLSGAWHLIRCKFCHANAERQGKGSGKLVLFWGLGGLKRHVENWHLDSARDDDLDEWCEYKKIDKEIFDDLKIKGPKRNDLNFNGLPFENNRLHTHANIARVAPNDGNEALDRTETRSEHSRREDRDGCWDFSKKSSNTLDESLPDPLRSPPPKKMKRSDGQTKKRYPAN